MAVGVCTTPWSVELEVALAVASIEVTVACNVELEVALAVASIEVTVACNVELEVALAEASPEYVVEDVEAVAVATDAERASPIAKTVDDEELPTEGPVALTFAEPGARVGA